MHTRIVLCCCCIVGAALCGPAALAAEKDKSPAKKAKTAKSSARKPVEDAGGEENQKLETATFGSGCFWCAEAVFKQLKGVKSVVSGYSGGTVANPTYELVSTDLTGHAECVQITYDANVVSFEALLDVFWKSHDPTKLNEQGPDHGTRYRSVIFYHDDQQKELAEKSKQQHGKSSRRRFVTEITKFTEFYPAEDYHQDYFANHPDEDYCQREIRPKVTKVRKLFKDKVSGQK